MVFNITLYVALILFALGMCYRFSTWFRNNVGLSPSNATTWARIAAAIKGCFLTMFSRQIGCLLKAFFVDVVFQLNIFKDKKDPLVWPMHMCIYGGFTLLLLMHALDHFVSSRLFADYYPTLNPFLFLRNVFGGIVMVGLTLAIIRRSLLKKSGLMRNTMDVYAMTILAIIVLSGFLLEATKINSHSLYKKMVEEYALFDSKEEAQALEAFWVGQFGVASPNNLGAVDAETLALGNKLNNISCSGCHSNPKWAFISYGMAKTIRSAALPLNKGHLLTILWYVHFLSCFFGLVYIPFGKMFHIVATPLSILVNAASKETTSDPVNIATKLCIELDGCKHGGGCHSECPIQKKRQRELNALARSKPILGYIEKHLRIRSD